MAEAVERTKYQISKKENEEGTHCDIIFGLKLITPLSYSLYNISRTIQHIIYLKCQSQLYFKSLAASCS